MSLSKAIFLLSDMALPDASLMLNEWRSGGYKRRQVELRVDTGAYFGGRSHSKPGGRLYTDFHSSLVV